MLLIKNIKSLVQVVDNPGKWIAGENMSRLNVLDNAYLYIKDSLISDYGEMSNLPQDLLNGEVIDASGKLVFPSFCDSHTHLVYAGSREIEYMDKIRGL